MYQTRGYTPAIPYVRLAVHASGSGCSVCPAPPGQPPVLFRCIAISDTQAMPVGSVCPFVIAPL